jgi:hypothetical protein
MEKTEIEIDLDALAADGSGELFAMTRAALLRGTITWLSRNGRRTGAIVPAFCVLASASGEPEADLALQAIQVRSGLRWLGEQMGERLSPAEREAANLVIGALQRELPAHRETR